MHTRIFPAPTFFFIIIAITLVQFPPSVHTVDDELYLNCSSTFECAGTSNLSYPFWGSNRPEYCGHPGFQLTCSGDAPLLNVTDMYYRVLKINGPARSLKIARADYWNTTCPANYANTTIDFSKIFSHTSDTTNLTLYYQCQYDTSSLLPNPSADGFPFTCDGDAEGEANYYWSSSPATTNENLILDACPYNVTVPVMKSVVASDTLTTEDALKKAIDGGFTVEWNANDIRCDRCEVSGGQCGFNTSTNAFVCHCLLHSHVNQQEVSIHPISQNFLTISCLYRLESAAVSGNLTNDQDALIHEASDGGSTSGPNANNSSMCNRCEVSGGQCGLNNSTNAFVCHCKTGSSPFTCESTTTSEGGSTSEWNDANNSSMCDRCKGSGGLCGFNTSTNAFVCHCTTRSSPFTCESTKASWKLRWWIIMIIGSAGVVLFSFVIVCCVKRGCLSNNSMVWRKRDAKNDHDHFNAEEVLKNFGSMAPKRYTYSEVKKLTNSFKDKVGHGGYGVVYKRKLADGRIVAVKVLGKSNDNGLDFINEVASISRTSHVNIVTLLGFCYGRTKRALIYEFVPNGSLDKFINNKVSSITKSQLDCKTMFKIALGIARGLEYLHRGCRTRILHFDIKPHNILLDEDLCPKISDFGLAKLCKTKESIVSMTGMRGTPGYIAPEVFRRCFGGVSHKSDVYSYGMLVLDMVGERKRRVGNTGVSHSSEILYFPDCIYDKLEQDREGFSSTCEGITSRPEEEDMLQKMIVVSLWCIQTNPSERPSMGKVIEMLEGSLQSLQLPPKPSANSPTILSAQD